MKILALKHWISLESPEAIVCIGDASVLLRTPLSVVIRTPAHSEIKWALCMDSYRGPVTRNPGNWVLGLNHPQTL